MRYSHVLLTAVAIAASLPSQPPVPPFWSLLTPAATNPPPSVRRSGAMAYDGTRLILFGGVSQTPSQILNETWAFNGQWSLLNPLGGAPGRWGHQMVRDTLLNRIITFGGRSPTISGFSDNTYTWNGSAWSEAVLTGSAPPARYLYGMAYDSVRDKVVVFGGRGLLTTLSDTWEGQVVVVGSTPGVTWQQVVTATSPPQREEMVMVYDSSAGRTMLFGGYDRETQTVLGDTWAYDGTDWELLTPETNPPARYRMASAYDSFRLRTVMYGGYDGNQILQDTWEFRAGNWYPITTTTPVAPTHATEMYAGYDPTPARRKFVTFGGAGTVFSNQTHEYTNLAGGFYFQFGTSCPSSQPNTVVTCSPAAPIIGTTLNLTFAQFDPNAEGVLVAIGFSEMLPPFDLGLFGLPGCELVVSPDLTQFILDGTPAGSATLAVPIPNNPSFINTSLYFQGLTVDLDLPTLFPNVSSAGRAVLGN